MTPAIYKTILKGLIVGLLLVLSGCVSKGAEPPKAENGFLDLSTWDFGGSNVTLAGEWMFLPQAGVSGSKDTDPKDRRDPVPVSMPGERRRPPVAGSDYAAGLFQLEVKLPDPNKKLAVYAGEAIGLYKIWIDGRMVVDGNALDTQIEKPYLLQTGPRASSGSVTIRVQPVYSPWPGGTPFIKLSMGEYDSLARKFEYDSVMEFLLVISLMVMAVYHLQLFVLRRRDPSALFLAGFCLMFGGYIAVTDYGAHAVVSLLPPLPWTLLVKSALMLKAACLSMLILFFRSLYPNRAARFIDRMIYLLCTVLIVWTFLASQALRDVLNEYFHIALIPVVLYVVGIVAAAVCRKKQGARIFLAGFGLFMGAAVLDVLTDLSVIRTPPMIPFGLLVLILSLGLGLAKRFSDAFRLAEELADELGEKNRELERMDALKDEFLANTSHELRTP